MVLFASVSSQFSVLEPCQQRPTGHGSQRQSVTVVLLSAPLILEGKGEMQAGDKQDAAKPSVGHT